MAYKTKTKSEMLEEAARYTLGNLDAAAKERLITAPANFQVQLSESRKMLRAALRMKEPRVFVVAPSASSPEDTSHQACTTNARGNLHDIYGSDDYEVEESFESLEQAVTYVKGTYGIKRVSVI